MREDEVSALVVLDVAEPEGVVVAPSFPSARMTKSFRPRALSSMVAGVMTSSVQDVANVVNKLATACTKAVPIIPTSGMKE
jgi:hypothetical protein